MKILHVIHSVDSRSGGPSNALRNLVCEQVRLGHTVSVLATTVQSAEPWEDRDAYRNRIRSDSMFFGAEVHLAAAFGRRRPWSRFAFSPQSSRWLRRRFGAASVCPDIVHIHCVFSHVTTAAAKLAAHNSVPYIIRPAGVLDACCLEMGHRRLKRIFNQLLLGSDFRRAACIHSTSSDETDHIRRLLPNCYVETIPHGVDVPLRDDVEASGRFFAAFPTLRECRVILCMSRLHPIKRLHLAVAALAQLLPRFPDLRLVIAGPDSGDLEALRGKVGEYGLQERVVFTGFLQGEMKAAAFSAATLFVHPSLHENYGVAVVEAMAYGLPVVTTVGVASREFVLQSGAGLVTEGNAASIAWAIKTILTADMSAAREKARAFVRERLSWPAVARQLDSLYRKAVAGGITASPQRPVADWA